MRILILEDSDERIVHFRRNLCGSELMIVKEAIYAINYLNNEKWDVLFLDHDLGGSVNVSEADKNTGSEVARFLNEHPDKIPNLIFIHSLNMTGCKYMKRLLPESVIIPFAWNKMTINDMEHIEIWRQMADSQNQQIEYGKL